MKLNIAYMKPSQLVDCAKIAAQIPGSCWGKSEIRKHLKKRNCGILVIQSGYEILGFLCFERKIKYCQIWTMGIKLKHRRHGLGKLLIDKIKETVSGKIVFHVRESNLASHLFLKKNQFYCTSIFRKYFIDNLTNKSIIEDSYCFEYNQGMDYKNEIVIFGSHGNIVAKLSSLVERESVINSRCDGI